MIPIETARLTIRPYRQEDAQDAFEIFGNQEVMKDCEPAYSMRQTIDTLKLFSKRKNAYAAVHRSECRVIGHLLFNQLPDEANGIYEIGWIFNERYWRQGYAFEAASALINFGFHEMNLHKICAETIDEIKSVNLMQKLGMKQEACFRQHTRDLNGNWVNLIWYAILSDEYREGQTSLTHS